MRGNSFNRAFVIVLALLGAICARINSTSQAADAPTIAAACDVADWRAAQLGRDRLPAPASADALLVVSGGAFVPPAFDAQQHAARIVALADAAGIDVVNVS